MTPNSHLSSTEHQLPSDTTEGGLEMLSTHDTLLQRRRTEMYARSLSDHRQTLAEFRHVLSGESIAQYLDAYAADIPAEIYARDYAGLEEYFKVTPLNDFVFEVRPIKRVDTLADRQAEVRLLLAATPFRQRLQRVVSEYEDLIALSPEPGVYELATQLNEADDIDAEISSLVSADRDGLRMSQRDGTRVIEVTVTDKAADEDSLWLQTDSAQALLSSLDRAGMSLTDEARRELSLESDHRYGNAYAWMTRELVKGVAGYSGGLIEQSDDSRLPNYTNDPGADLLIDVLRQLRLRGDGSHPSDIPVTHDYINLRDKGCKDVETYFAQSAALPGKLTTVSIEGKRFWHRTHGGHTYLNLDTVVYNGIELPPGYVFKQAEDGGYALLRATGFAFDKAMADQLFGAPLTENYKIAGGEEDMQRAFSRFAAQRNQANQ